MFSVETNLNQEVYCGKNFCQDLDSFFGEEIKGRDVCLITGRNFFSESDFSNQLESLFKTWKVNKVMETRRVFPNPHIKDIEPLSSTELSPEIILAVGGGSVIDYVKKLKLDYYPNSSVWVIYTRYGSGSVVTPFFVYNNGEFKIGEHSQGVIPSRVYCSLEMMELLPKKEKVIGISDIFAHATESFLSTKGSKKSSERAQEALSKISNFIEEPLENLIKADIKAALAESEALVLLPHAIGHYLTSVYDIPHGIASIAPLKVYAQILIEKGVRVDFCKNAIRRQEGLIEQFLNAGGGFPEISFSDEEVQESYNLINEYMQFSFSNSHVDIDFDTYKSILLKISSNY